MTPDVIYYQAYNDSYVGGLIYVRDPGTAPTEDFSVKSVVLDSLNSTTARLTWDIGARHTKYRVERRALSVDLSTTRTGYLDVHPSTLFETYATSSSAFMNTFDLVPLKLYEW